MALTATAQSALPREPTWDEVIVPALRKRLKDESNALAKRISAASITSNEEQPAQYYATRPGTSTSSYSQSNKPSAIPRPSLQSSRTTESTTGVYAGALPPPIHRARALSQPYPFESLISAESPPMSDTRPISPVNPPKGTRIPVSRTRTGSTSSQAQSAYNGSAGRVNGTSTYQRHNGEPSDSQLWPVEEKEKIPQSHSQTSRSTIQVPRRKVSDIFQEQAPFPPNSVSPSHSQLDYDPRTPERMSSDSEEHPFEHWYRGDVARNGGVGELRVARRQEMLDIANYGHTLRKASIKQLHLHGGQSPRSRSSSRGRDTADGRTRTRQRAGSVGARESIYIDQEEMDAGTTVMDERPLTDLEDDGYEDHLDEYYTQAVLPYPNGSISSPSLERSDTPTSRMTQNTTKSRIPQPTSRSRTTTPTPARPTRSASESGSVLSGPSSFAISPQMPRSSSQSKSPSLSPNLSIPSPGTPNLSSSSTPSTPTAKRRAKSPANAAPASASKKQKAKAPPSSMQKRPGAKNEENRRSIGQYPMPEGDEDAIPTWTQPVPANGNWDDVVLPVVARKKGLQDQYEQADGSPKPREPEPVVIEPAPGTFGFDAEKYRKRYSAHPEQIPMDEFGQKPSSPAQETSSATLNEHAQSPTPPNGVPRTPQSYDRSNRAESPPPFSHYAGGDTAGSPLPQLQTMGPLPVHRNKEQQQHMVEDDGGAGCCKCVVM